MKLTKSILKKIIKEEYDSTRWHTGGDDVGETYDYWWERLNEVMQEMLESFSPSFVGRPISIHKHDGPGPGIEGQGVITGMVEDDQDLFWIAETEDGQEVKLDNGDFTLTDERRKISGDR